MVFRVRTTERAEQDILEILDWLATEQAGIAGLRWFEGLEMAIASLAQSPMRCPLIPGGGSLEAGDRYLLYGKKPHAYRIVFAVRGEDVFILHVWHGRRLLQRTH